MDSFLADPLLGQGGSGSDHVFQSTNAVIRRHTGDVSLCPVQLVDGVLALLFEAGNILTLVPRRPQLFQRRRSSQDRDLVGCFREADRASQFALFGGRSTRRNSSELLVQRTLPAVDRRGKSELVVAAYHVVGEQ